MEKTGQFALVSTLEADGFPCHEVLIFDSERDAVQCACDLIINSCDDFSVASYNSDECVWVIGEDHFDEPGDFLEAFQDTLQPLEYFHVYPVVSKDAS